MQDLKLNMLERSGNAYYSVRLSQILMQDLKRSGYRVPSLWPEVRLSQILMQDLKLSKKRLR